MAKLLKCIPSKYRLPCHRSQRVEIRGGSKINIKHKIWLEKDGRVLFGHGRDKLLKAIEECQSLNAAAKKLNMSYRAAWGRLKASEDRMGCKLVEHQQGRRMHLTA